MACCAFVAFVIGQCLALFEGWRRRVAVLLRLPVPAPPDGTPRIPPRWRAGLLAAVVLELGIAAGFTLAAAGASPDALAAWCRPAAIGGR